jgi:uncharacterized protein YqjF (DUF2071 family)
MAEAPAVRTVFARQQWRMLTFVHWPLPAELARPLLPAGLEPDVMDDTSWVSMVPFAMVRSGVRGLPAVPYLGDLLECNVRLYAVDGRGRHGVVFLSMDASRLAVVLGARAALRLPYRWADMSLVTDGSAIRYTVRARWPSPAGAATALGVRIGGPVEPDPLDDFLTLRWRLWTRTYTGRVISVAVSHPSWQLYEAERTWGDDALLTAAGLPALGTPARVRYSPGVLAQLGRDAPA